MLSSSELRHQEEGSYLLWKLAPLNEDIQVRDPLSYVNCILQRVVFKPEITNCLFALLSNSDNSLVKRNLYYLYADLASDEKHLPALFHQLSLNPFRETLLKALTKEKNEEVVVAALSFLQSLSVISLY